MEQQGYASAMSSQVESFLRSEDRVNSSDMPSELSQKMVRLSIVEKSMESSKIEAKRYMEYNDIGRYIENLRRWAIMSCEVHYQQDKIQNGY